MTALFFCLISDSTASQLGRDFENSAHVFKVLSDLLSNIPAKKKTTTTELMIENQ
jgi:hypothetical protein